MRKKSNRSNIKQNNKKTESKGISTDILLLIFGLIAVFFFLSLVSYSKLDPSDTVLEFSKYGSKEIENLFGRLGAYTADQLGTAFGWAALFIPFMFMYMSILLYRYKKGLTFMLSPVLCFINSMCIIMCFSVLSGLIGGMDFYFSTQPAGGILGVIGSKIIQSVIGQVGGIIVFICLIIAFSMLLFSISFEDMGQGFRVLFSKIKSIFKFIFSRKDNNIDDEYDELDEVPALEHKPTLKGKIVEPISNIASKITSPFKKEKDNSKALVPYEETPDKLLDDDELNAISNIPFMENQHTGEDDIQKGDNQAKNIHVIEDYEIIEPEIIEKAEIIEEKIEKAEESVQKVQAEPLIKKAYEHKEEQEDIEIREMNNSQKTLFTNYNIPMSLLSDPKNDVKVDSEEDMKAQGDILVQKLQDFNVNGTIRAIQPGPVVTMFELEPAAGTRVAKIASLENDLALSMSALSIRIIAPIPGKNAVGIEIPNKNRASVSIKELLKTKEFASSKSPLTVALGKDATGKPYMSDIRKMPHLLVAGTTGSGKSVGINTMICSILYKASPDEVKFIMIDPKMVELSVYEGIPHLLAPVVTDTRLAASVLKNVVAEMTRRYSLLAQNKVRNLDGYNELVAKNPDLEKMPYLVVIVDEFADLMMVSGKDVEISIARIAQMARAVGIHLIIATQRPTTNVITGLIKANMPARLSFRVSQKNDSRVILDQNGADTLLGMGDSLFIPPGSSDPVRIHGAFLSDDEVRNIVEYLQQTYGEPDYNMDILKEEKESSSSKSNNEDRDEKYEEALDIVYEKGSASISMIQRHLKIGYNRAARIIEMMEEEGIIAPSDGTSKPREVIRR